MSNNGWTPERRARQAELIRQWQPWANATGAKTAEGKARSSRNAYKGGHRKELREMMQRLNGLLKEQDELTKDWLH